VTPLDKIVVDAVARQERRACLLQQQDVILQLKRTPAPSVASAETIDRLMMPTTRSRNDPLTFNNNAAAADGSDVAIIRDRDNNSCVSSCMYYSIA